MCVILSANLEPSQGKGAVWPNWDKGFQFVCHVSKSDIETVLFVHMARGFPTAYVSPPSPSELDFFLLRINAFFRVLRSQHYPTLRMAYELLVCSI